MKKNPNIPGEPGAKVGPRAAQSEEGASARNGEGRPNPEEKRPGVPEEEPSQAPEGPAAVAAEEDGAAHLTAMPEGTDDFSGDREDGADFGEPARPNAETGLDAENRPEIGMGPDDSVHDGRFDRLMQERGGVRKLTGMYKEWFLDYASYVILERAVPHMEDGLKPVQRRILHSMKRMDDGRYNKVANIVGHTMQFHPHGDASIGEALVQLGQKELLIDTQGNWGNILTGDSAAAARYIEARLSKFALDVVFNPKTTEWMASYDGRNEEPVTLPVKFPLLLAQGVEGIAVGLASKILPHNFCELIDASIAHLRGEPFTLLPDFPTGGMADCTRYNDGLRGGAVKVRARIAKVDKRTLAISEIPYTTTTESLKESIIRANDKGKIKIRRVDDNTAEHVELIIHVAADESSDRTIDALYAFTDCEVSISPNACIIYDDKPHFLGASEILRRTAERTRYLLGRELDIRLDELEAAWHRCSLERIFIVEKLYQLIEGCRTREAAYEAVDAGLEPFKGRLRHEVTRDDVVHLTSLPFIRISRYDEERATEELQSIEQEIEQVRYDREHLTAYAIAYYERIRRKYGAGRERRTELRAFDEIDATRVAVTNAKLYVDRREGFFGTGTQMRREEYVCDCSDMDEVLVLTREGRYTITKVSDKAFFAKNIHYIGIYKRGDERTIYNLLYRDGAGGPVMMKRTAITGVLRDREYDLTRGAARSEILYFSCNPNGEAEVLKIYFKPRPRLKRVVVDLDFSAVPIRGRQSRGNLFSRYAIQRIVVKERGASTLGRQRFYFDEDVMRLNTEGRGRAVGEFAGDEKLVVFTARNRFYTAPVDPGHHFPDDTVRVEPFDPQRVYTAVYFDPAAGYTYLKRFCATSTERLQPFLDEEGACQLRHLTMAPEPRFLVTFAGSHAARPAEEVEAATFIGVKSARARGKRLTPYPVGEVRLLEPEVSGEESSASEGAVGDASGPEGTPETEGRATEAQGAPAAGGRPEAESPQREGTPEPAPREGAEPEGVHRLGSETPGDGELPDRRETAVGEPARRIRSGRPTPDGDQEPITPTKGAEAPSGANGPIPPAADGSAAYPSEPTVEEPPAPERRKRGRPRRTEGMQPAAPADEKAASTSEAEPTEENGEGGQLNLFG